MKTGAWSPTPTEWSRAAEIVERCEPHELARISRLRIEDDRKRSLTGRLLLRYASSIHTGLKYDKVRLERSENNKPTCSDMLKGDINISHHGDWVVIASDSERKIGVDVMKFEEPRRGKETFFNSMRRQFTEAEWTAIDNSLERFYTYWALKESYVKAIGIGIGFSLQRINFCVSGIDAKVEIDGRLEDDWEFDLAPLDECHVVAVALGPPKNKDSSAGMPFKILTVDELMSLLV